MLCTAGILCMLLSGGGVAKSRATAHRPPERHGSAAKPVAAVPSAFLAAAGFTTLTASGPSGDFPVQVFYPAGRPGAGTPVVRTGAPYPLIVFSPGFDIDPSSYEALTDAWAAAGFVVAVPNYPFTGPGAAGGIHEADIVNHPADMHSAIDGILAASASPTGLIAGAVDPTRVAAAGHSDGGDVTDAAVANTCCMDPRIKAAAVFAGAELTSFGGEYEAISVPVLVVQGGADEVNPPACSEQIYRDARSARYYLDLPAAGHHSPYLQTGTPMTPSAFGYRQAVEKVSLLFWQAYLNGNAAARSELAALSSTPERLPGATLVAGSSIAAGGTCPGGPQ